MWTFRWGGRRWGQFGGGRKPGGNVPGDGAIVEIFTVRRPRFRVFCRSGGGGYAGGGGRVGRVVGEPCSVVLGGAGEGDSRGVADDFRDEGSACAGGGAGGDGRSAEEGRGAI